MTLSQYLNKVRIEKELTLRQMQLVHGVDCLWLSDFERNKKLASYDEIKKLCKIYDLDPKFVVKFFPQSLNETETPQEVFPFVCKKMSPKKLDKLFKLINNKK